ncbi:hypothetical protein EYR41_007073 [Orbilia oligospora]|uniref:Uncharacterized protein n=1 Tax=Orbilia oligospora TaxID=2813651 RepID=A0A8H2HSX1_ORBOL|nr:hypothetical protein EYR41_007073 [Orbilia oligospora]
MLPHMLCQCQSAVLPLLQYPKLERMLHVGTIGLHIFKDSIQRDETQKDCCAPTNEHAKVVLALSLPSDAVVVTFLRVAQQRPREKRRDRACWDKPKNRSKEREVKNAKKKNSREESVPGRDCRPGIRKVFYWRWPGEECEHEANLSDHFPT